MFENNFIKQVQGYKADEIIREVSVYRYMVQKPFSSADIRQKINKNLLRKSMFGIVEELPSKDKSIRTLWAKLGQRTLPHVDEEGHVTYWEIDRVIVSTAVVEFFNDDGQSGVIIFGGSAGIHNDLISTLENSFGYRNPTLLTLKPDQLRNIFERYWRKIKEINLDPSDDAAWGDVRDAKLASTRGKYINVEAEILRSIRQNRQILILGFKSAIEKAYVSGMKKEVKAGFELLQKSIRITISDFALWEAAERGKTEEIFYDLVRNVYFAIIGDEKWVDSRPPVATLPLFGSITFENTEDD